MPSIFRMRVWKRRERSPTYFGFNFGYNREFVDTGLSTGCFSQACSFLCLVAVPGGRRRTVVRLEAIRS